MTPTITRIDIYEMNVALHEPFVIALGTSYRAENLLVRVHTSDGMCGLGEASPFPTITGETQATAFEAARSLARLLLGKDPTDIEGRVAEMNAALPRNPAAKCSLDLALYDLLARRAGLPLYALLGGARRRIRTDFTISITPPAEIAAKARAVKDRGFRTIKLKLGTNLAADIARVQAVRQEVGDDIRLSVDANQGWSAATAVAVLREIDRYGVEHCEQPVPAWDHQALKTVREASPIPIVADEACFDHHDAYTLARSGAADMFNIKLAKSGGLHTALKIAAAAEAAGLRCMVGCMLEARIGITASAHLAAARPVISYADLDGILLHAEDPVAGGVTVEGDELVLPDAPGLGVEVDPAYLASLEGASVNSLEHR
jgi:L-alanine-DL-glutamate epimerase-like enolase superfamily enzyme